MQGRLGLGARGIWHVRGMYTVLISTLMSARLSVLWFCCQYVGSLGSTICHEAYCWLSVSRECRGMAVLCLVF